MFAGDAGRDLRVLKKIEGGNIMCIILFIWLIITAILFILLLPACINATSIWLVIFAIVYALFIWTPLTWIFIDEVFKRKKSKLLLI